MLAVARRNWLFRTSIFINAAVLLYFASYITTRNGGFDFMDDIQLQLQPSALAKGAELSQQPDVNRESPVPAIADQQPQQVQTGNVVAGAGANGPPLAALQIPSGSQQQPQASVNTVVQGTTTNAQRTRTTKASTTVKLPGESESGSVATPEVTEAAKTLKDVVQCHDKDNNFRIAQKGDFWVLYNYVTANRSFHCYETITYTTHADYTFLDNLEPLVERWKGPVSLALYSPGSDFTATLNTIRYLRTCVSPLVSEFVTFHVYFGSKHVPKSIPKPDGVVLKKNNFNCSRPAPWINVSTSSLYKTQKKLLYPVNVGRNIARNSAVTHYILASDIELYPSPGIITDFMEMIRRQDAPILRKNPKVFPLSLFEVEAHINPPASKKELVAMLKNHSAIPFHKKVCPDCHNVPKSKEWISAPFKQGLHVFHIGKRLGHFVHWEPVFIGTHNDPFYDERLSWEGKRDKMTQGYALCVLDYEFHILDNGFLVHKPGIKTLKIDQARAILSGRTNALIRKVIFPELKVLYGSRKGCAV